ncbi:MAG: serine/threonine-protein kinase [Kofleriaceae bacterium]
MREDTDARRPRTVSRHRFVAPPGMEVDGGEGHQTIGRYEIVKMLGKGAMGVVYKARDPLLDRTVALKTIVSPQGSGKRIRSAYLERFQREAKAAAKMPHPAIVTIFDVGVDDASGAPFMVLEYLPGESLADRLDRVRMPLGRGVNIALDLASALSFAHRQRIVHRDVKPANVLHAGEQRWKLADFGIARMPDSDLTQVGIFMGTPGYAPPEAIREGRYTAQADVFAWGALLYELLCGRIPYEGPDTKTTNGFVCKGDAPPPTHHDASVPGPLADICMAALDPSPQRRYKDGGEAEAALRTAWERCLREALVTPMALAGDEVPHERVSGGMHASVTSRPAPVTATSGLNPLETADLLPADHEPADDEATIVQGERGDTDPGQVTVRRDPPEAGRAVSLRTSKPSRPVAPVVEARGLVRPGDDDPTRILGARVGERRGDDRRAADRRTDPKRAPAALATSRVNPLRPIGAVDPPSRAPWVFVIVLAISIAAVVATYLATH